MHDTLRLPAITFWVCMADTLTNSRGGIIMLDQVGFGVRGLLAGCDKTSRHDEREQHGGEQLWLLPCDCSRCADRGPSARVCVQLSGNSY